MFDPILEATLKKSKLWDHQVDALRFAIKHLNELESPCLIRMPTGTGKTGVIACLTMLSNQGSSLVLTPWVNLREQMIEELNNHIWGKIKISPREIKAVDMFPSTAKDVLKTKEPQVIVSTFATLNALRLNYAETYKALAEAITLVVVDEGHYEPAVEWGKSVKGLKRKTLLLTATPYRNDLKLFRITNTKRSTHHFTHKSAVERKIIRKLSFESIESPDNTIASLSTAFAKRWREMKRSEMLPSRSPRAIICCSGASDIEATVAHLRKAGLKAIGIHEQFVKLKKDELFKNVPKPTLEKSEIWVHQHKLTEGLDDKCFCCVALFTQIHNDRKLIQQIGRVLRRDPVDRTSPAVLLAPKAYSAEAEWIAYLEFETHHELLEPQHFRDVVNKMLELQPEVEYFEGRFRKRFVPTDQSQISRVIIPPSVLVRAVGSDFRIDDYIEDCTDTLNIEDAVILGSDMNQPCMKTVNSALWVYASVSNSRFLQNTSLYEIKLETHCVVVAEGLVFMTDSRGNFPDEYLEEQTTRVSPKQLARYLDLTFRPTHVSIDSTIPYDTVLRGAEIRGHNLLSIPPSLTDRVQICRSARGTSKKLGRRYVGMDSGRIKKEVAEEYRRTFKLDSFVDWVKSVAKILNSSVDGSTLFQRYMPTCEPPTDPVPKTICLDLLRHDIELLVDAKPCHLVNSACDVVQTVRDKLNIYTCSFNLEGADVDDESIVLRIEYHSTKRRFWFYKEEGTAVQVSLEGEEESSNKSLADFINQKQDILLIGLDGGEIVYQGRNFYKIDYTYAEQVLLNLIQRPPDAPECATEKGTTPQIAAVRRAKQSKFPLNSLFRAIVDRHAGIPFSDEFLICADLGTECADFVAANFKTHQLALIHAKVGTGTRISASAFHEIVAQAMKNLVYLTRNSEVPKGVDSWRKDAKWNKTNVPRLYNLPKGFPDRLELWNKVKNEIIGSSNPALFVVLVTAGCCDLQILKDAVYDPSKRTPEVAQLLHLLDGLNVYARQLGVQLIIRDLPC